MLKTPRGDRTWVHYEMRISRHTSETSPMCRFYQRSSISRPRSICARDAKRTRAADGFGKCSNGAHIVLLTIRPSVGQTTRQFETQRARPTSRHLGHRLPCVGLREMNIIVGNRVRRNKLAATKHSAGCLRAMIDDAVACGFGECLCRTHLALTGCGT
ncbi:hypothetical protein GGS20DRAFT_526768 [Poronia punctata]|nr:hypothetical protein GGS20DRAFT_526768 [Poronia punctata]